MIHKRAEENAWNTVRGLINASPLIIIITVTLIFNIFLLKKNLKLNEPNIRQWGAGCADSRWLSALLPADPFQPRLASSGLLNCLHLPLLTPEFQIHLGAQSGLSVIKYAYFLKPKVFSLNVISGKLFYRKWKSKINTLWCHRVPSGQLFTVLQQNKLAKCGNWFSSWVSRTSELLWLLQTSSRIPHPPPHLTRHEAGFPEHRTLNKFMAIPQSWAKV